MLHYVHPSNPKSLTFNVRQFSETGWCQLPGVSEECSLTHPGKNPVPLNVEISGFDSQFQEVNCHRRQPVVVRQPGIMLSRAGKHMSDAAGEALDMLATQFFLLEWHICRFH